jgi:uncharacterized protein YlxW (UPF0749 family)
MKNTTKAHFVISIVCFILGMLLVAQFRSVQISGGTATSFQRAQELSTQLKTVIEERDMYKKELLELRNRITEYENAASQISGLNRCYEKGIGKSPYECRVNSRNRARSCYHP